MVATDTKMWYMICCYWHGIRKVVSEDRKAGARNQGQILTKRAGHENSHILIDHMQ